MARNDGTFAPWHISVSFQGCAIQQKSARFIFYCLHNLGALRGLVIVA